MRAPGRHDDERIFGHDTGPARRKRHNAVIPVDVEDPVLAPAVDVVDQFELAPEQRMEWVGYSETSLLNIRMGCIRQLSPTRTASDSLEACGANVSTILSS